ncbi:MAG TPA: HAD-IB family phosphatase [Terriglobales bacterium]|nr:HAD-IB family phosphatase [Terriglobales bacterium]
MTSSISPKATAFIDSVLRLKPELAVFDCDGTLWAGDAGEGFFDWELKRGLVPDEIVRWARPRYADYKAGNVDEDTMCAEMVTMHRGLKEADLQRAATEYFDQNFVEQVFPEMRDLVHRLQKSGGDVWAVSSTNLWVIQAGMKHLGIPQGRILAATAEVKNGTITDRMVRVPSGEGKPKAIHEVIRKNPDAAFGNSRWDTEMLSLARHAFAVNPNSDLETTARQLRWTVYWPDGTRAF